MSTSVSLQTTVVGSFPKPKYIKIPDFFSDNAKGEKPVGLLGIGTDAYSQFMGSKSKEDLENLEKDILQATEEIIQEQHECGVDVVTDGEVRRENYIYYFCRFVDGISFEEMTEVGVRNNAYKANVPTIVGDVKWRGPINLAEEWKKSQEKSTVPVKYTLPGPMTIMGSTVDVHYKDEKRLAADLAAVVNRHVLELAAAGCKHIQVDEPVFARNPDKALDYGVECLEKCFEGCPPDVEKAMHMCCGYPGHVDHKDYPKADQGSYVRLAPALDASIIDAVSIEDAWCSNDLSLLSLFEKTKVILGSINVSSSRVESVEEIQARLSDALEHIDPERLIVAPDCGLALLDGEKYRPLLNLKLGNMCKAAKCVPCKGNRRKARRTLNSNGEELASLVPNVAAELVAA